MVQLLRSSCSLFRAVLLTTLLAECLPKPASAETLPPVVAIGYFAGCGLWGCTETWITADGKTCIADYSPGRKPQVRVTSGTVPKEAFLKIVRLYQSNPPDKVRGHADGSTITDISSDTLEIRMADGSKKTISAYGGTDDRRFSHIAEEIAAVAHDARGARVSDGNDWSKHSCIH